MYIASLLLTMQGLKEYKDAISHKDLYIDKKVIYIISIGLFVTNITYSNFRLKGFVVFLLILCSILLIDLYRNKNKLKKQFLAWLGLLYVLIGLESIVLIRNVLPNGEVYTWLIFIITIVTDSMAYFTGKIFGKNKLAPLISPNKTIEGSVGGIFFSTISCFLYSLFVKVNSFNLLFIGLIGSMVSQLGDLIASALKRYVGIKDYSNLIPEHGGVLDRLDSAILVSQFIFIVIIVLGIN